MLSDGAFLALFLLGLALVVGVAILSYVQAKKRREAMAAFATARGWTYAEDEPRLIDRFHGAPFGEGFGQRAYNVILGKHDGRDLVSFDYLYKTHSGSGKDRKTVTHHFSVLGLSMGVPLPSLTVDPEGFFDRVVNRLVNSDIELEFEDFNRAFTVTCPDRKFASDVLHPQMMEYLLQYPDLGWRFERDSMLVVAHGHRDVTQIDPTLAVMDGIIGPDPGVRVAPGARGRLRAMREYVVWVVIGVVVLVLLSLVVMYNRFVRQRTLSRSHGAASTSSSPAATT